MNIDVYYKVSRKVLEKKYPWINDIVITHDYDVDGDHVFGLEVHVDKDFKENEIFMDKHEVDVERDAKAIFDMMSPQRWQKFDRVRLF